MAILIETRLNALKLNENAQPRKGCLGRIEGICADFNNPTRNGRLYTKKLWENVFNDPIFKESLESKTLFGELDHPEERLEVLAKEACVVMTDYRIDEDEGVVYAGFDILDTPKGKILKSLLDYGSVMGVSSRGQGDITESGNGEIVDEDTYDFACFDVVTTPAVEKARQNVVESVQRTKTFKESLKAQINSAETIGDLNSIKKVIKLTNLPDMDSLIESIDNKCNSIKEGKIITSTDKELQTALDTISELKKQLKQNKSANTIRENKEMFECINSLRKQVSAYKHREEQFIDSIKKRDTEINKLQSQCDNNKLVKEKLNSTKSYNAKLKTKFDSLVSDMNKQSDKLTEDLNKYKSESALYRRKSNEYENTISDLNESIKSKNKEITNYSQTVRSLNNTIDSLNNKITSLTEELSDTQRVNEQSINKNQRTMDNMESEINSYTDIIDNLQEQLKNVKAKNSSLTEDKAKCVNAYKKLSAHIEGLQKSYITTKARQLGVDGSNIKISTSSTAKQIDKMLEELQATKDRYAKLPISESSILGLSVQSDLLKPSEEDAEYDSIYSFIDQVTKSL